MTALHEITHRKKSNHEPVLVNTDVEWLEANKPRTLRLITTARNAAQPIIDYADTVTHVTKVKYAYDAGSKACAGIEF